MEVPPAATDAASSGALKPTLALIDESEYDASAEVPLPPLSSGFASNADLFQDGKDPLIDYVSDPGAQSFGIGRDSLRATLCQSIKDAVHFVIPYGGLASNVFSLASVTLGGGVISMPISFATSGIMMAIIYLVVITIITVYTMTLMGWAMEKTGTRTYETMARLLFGGGWDYAVGFVLWISCFGTAVAYISAIMGLIHPIVQSATESGSFIASEAGERLITSMIWLTVMVPIVIPKRLNSIRYVSTFGVCMVVYFVIAIVIHSSRNGLKLGMRDDMKFFSKGNQAVYGLSIFIFAYLCQALSYAVYFEMKPTPSVKKLTVASAIAATTCMVFYVLAGFFGYMDFAGATKDSILYNFDPVHEPMMMVAYIGMLIKLCACYAVNMIPARNFMYHCLQWDLEALPYWKHALLILTTSLVTLLLGLFIPTVNLAFGLVGSLCGGFIGFLFPAFFWMYSGKWSLRTVGLFNYVATYLLIGCGVVAITFGTIATIYMSFFQY